MNRNRLSRMTLSAMFLALAMLLPFITGQVPSIGNMLCPMHIPVLLCGFICGPVYGGLVGFISPVLRYILFAMPPLVPNGIPMSFELLTYGLVSGFLFQLLQRKTSGIYLSLLAAMIAGRVVWGFVKSLILGLSGSQFTLSMFIAGALTNAIPGIILQLILIPLLVMSISKFEKKNS